MLRLRILLRLSLALPVGACQPPPAAAPTPPAEPEPEPEPLPPAEEILARSIDAVGGKAAIEAITSSYTRTKTEITAQNITMVSHIWTKGGNFYMESDMPGMGLTQRWKKGDEIWAKDPISGLRKLEGAEEAQARWSSDPVLAANWSKYFATAETIGRSKAGDQEVVEVELAAEDGDQTIVLLFDEQTAMPAGMVFEQQGPMGSMKIRVTTSDFREIEGVKVPFRSVSDLQLMSVVQVTEEYQVNVEVDDAKFEPPPPPGAKPEPEPEPEPDAGTKGTKGKKGSAKKGSAKKGE